MDAFVESLRVFHVVLGFAALAAYWIPIVAKKGAVNHVRFGKIFVWSAYGVLGVAAITLTHRLADLIADGQSPATRPELFAFLVFLGYLTIISFVTVHQGMNVLQHKQKPAETNTTTNRVLAIASILSSLFVIGYAIVLQPGNLILLLALSPIGIGIGRGKFRYMQGESASRRAWMYEHMGAMIGAGIAFHTAFAVFGASQLFDIGLSGIAAIIPWVLPSVIGIPASAIWVRHYKKKFGEMSKPA